MTKDSPKPAPGQGPGRMVWVEAAPWAECLRLAAELGCLVPSGRAAGEPSVSRLLTDLGEGALVLRRVAPPTGGPSQAARIRQQIELSPTATNQEIAAILRLPGKYPSGWVAKERQRMAERAARDAEAD